jgi:starch synthase
MNLIINEMDHPLIIKVASIQIARMQVYFIDNDDYFQRKFIFQSKTGKFFKDNDERSIFYARGVIETVKKLGWAPDIIHINGWFGSLVPMYLRKVFKNNPLFSESKIVISLFNDGFEDSFDKGFLNKLVNEGLEESELTHYKELSYVGFMKSAIDYSDAIIFNDEVLNPELVSYAQASGKPVLPYVSGDEYKQAFNDLYDKLLER